MAVEVRYTPDFERQLKRLANKYLSIYKDIEGLVDDLEESPNIGKPLGKNLYKIRLAISGKAKAVERE
jgi:mRNA-degrading endonuclease RelE of RelBE toxin-antitoxin system